MNLNVFIKRNPSAVVNRIKNNLYILLAKEQRFIILNNTAETIWRYLWKRRKIEEIVHYYTKKYPLIKSAKEDCWQLINKGLQSKLFIVVS